MSLIVLLALLVPAGLFVLGLFLVRAITAPHLDPVARSARQRSVIATLATLAVGVGAVWFWNHLALVDLPIRLATMPALAGTVATLAASVAELTWPRPSGRVRQASIGARRGVTAPRLRSAFLATSAITAAALVTGAASAGGTGQQLVREWGNRGAAHGPYPGPPYAAPMALACAALLVATALGLWLVARRPALAPGHDAADQALRQASQIRVLRGAVFGMGATGAGLLWVMGQAALGVTGGPDGYPGTTLRLLGIAALVVAACCAVVAAAAVVWPSPRTPGEPADHPHPSTVPALP